jgi:hypothetical protein
MRNGLIVDSFGTKYWYLNDQLHREDAPAVEYPNGDKEWYLHNQLHRANGPAIEWANGDKHWYLHDKEIVINSNEEFLRYVKLKGFWQ